MPNVMAALPNIGGALYSALQSLADAHTPVPCSNAANIGERNLRRLRLGKEKRKKIERKMKKPQAKNIMVCPIP